MTHTGQTVCFADITNSTRLYQALGDDAGHELVSRILDLLSQVVNASGGRVIKTLGDAVMAAFDKPAQALSAATAMQGKVATLTLPAAGLPRLTLHVGLHHGSVVEQDGDVHGAAVIAASRLSELAGPGQILVSEPTLLAVEGASCPSRFVCNLRLKGFEEGLPVCEAVWNQNEQTRIGAPVLSPQQGQTRLVLNHGPVRITVHAGNPEVVLGRGEQNDLVVRDPWVSRVHARLERRGGNFILVDWSANGTWIYPKGGKPLAVKQGETVLAGKGVICLGRDGGADSPDALHFEILESSAMEEPV